MKVCSAPTTGAFVGDRRTDTAALCGTVTTLISTELLNATGKLVLMHKSVQPSPETGGDQIMWADRKGGIWWSSGTLDLDSRERCAFCDGPIRNRVVYRHAGTQAVVCETCVEISP